MFGRKNAHLATLALALLASVAHADTFEQEKLVGNNGGAGDLFGGGGFVLGFGGPAVAVDGDVMVVGAILDGIGANGSQGSATVYRWNGSTWLEEQRLTSASGQPGDQFGSSVAVSRGLIVVGAQRTDIGIDIDQGAATVFRWNGTSWAEEQRLTYTGGRAGDWLGNSVATEGRVIVVGAPYDDNGIYTDQGTAVVFHFDGTSWIEERLLLPTNGQPDDHFGASVSVSGFWIVVGSRSDDVGGNVDQGSASTFRWNGSVWLDQQLITASNGAAGDLFGHAVSVDDDVIVVGSYHDDVGGEDNQGSATVFRRDVITWFEEQQLTATGGESDDYFGGSVSVSGDVIGIGAFAGDVIDTKNEGTATIFRHDGTAWRGELELVASDAGANDNFGASIAVSGSTLVSGAPRHDFGGSSNQGAAYVFDITPSAWSDQGAALAGALGEPQFVGCGTLADGSPNSLGLAQAASGATALLFAAVSSTPVPFIGGTLKAFPFFGATTLTTDTAGQIAIQFVMPSGVSAGVELWVQWAILDPAAIHGVALSNAVLGVTP